MLDRIRRFFGDEEGLSSVEYALLLALIVIACLSTWQALAQAIPTRAVNVAADAMSH
jgi:Flp pilus assembly pilin Flp